MTSSINCPGQSAGVVHGKNSAAVPRERSMAAAVNAFRADGRHALGLHGPSQCRIFENAWNRAGLKVV